MAIALLRGPHPRQRAARARAPRGHLRAARQGRRRVPRDAGSARRPGEARRADQVLQWLGAASPTGAAMDVQPDQLRYDDLEIVGSTIVPEPDDLPRRLSPIY